MSRRRSGVRPMSREAHSKRRPHVAGRTSFARSRNMMLVEVRSRSIESFWRPAFNFRSPQERTWHRSLRLFGALFIGAHGDDRDI